MFVKYFGESHILLVIFIWWVDVPLWKINTIIKEKPFGNHIKCEQQLFLTAPLWWKRWSLKTCHSITFPVMTSVFNGPLLKSFYYTEALTILNIHFMVLLRQSILNLLGFVYPVRFFSWVAFMSLIYLQSTIVDNR